MNVYQCSQMNTKKQTQKKTDHYNIRSKGALPTLGEMQENIRMLIRKVDPLVILKQKTQSKPGKIAKNKSTSMSSNLQNTPLDNTNIRSTLDTSVSLPPLDYNIIDDMKKTRVNISLFELANIQSQ